MKSVDVIQVLRNTLPQHIFYQGITFDFKLFLNGTELRFTYEISDVDKKSKHYNFYAATGLWRNKFEDEKKIDWLYLNEGFINSKGLYDAIENCYSFLCANKLIKKSK